MSEYKSKYGLVIKHDDVLAMEKKGLSDSLIAQHYQLSRTGFMKVRKSMGWKRKYRGFRADKGVSRKTSEGKREKRAENARRKYIPKDSEIHYCFFCNSVWNRDDGIEGSENGGEKKYVCGDCCRKKFKQGEKHEEDLKAVWKYEEDE